MYTQFLKKCSFLRPCGYQDGSCGYCKDPESSGSLYALAKGLKIQHYEKLVHRGWRRSGITLYKPDQLRSCCPHYTIRLPAAELQLSKEQRQTLHRWNRFVLGEKYIKEAARLHPKSKEEKKKDRNAFDFISTVHASEYANVQTPPEPDHKFEVKLEKSEFTEEKYVLFEQYQRLIHREPPERISKRGFRNFLCDSPLNAAVATRPDDTVSQIGSFHQCYRLDGKLIALGVVDLLPNAVSAVYFIYDVGYEKYGFGKLSALREAALAVEGGYQYYNMGFYIHSCAKMRYKQDYKPQYLLDPDTYEWHELNDALKAKLDARKFVSPSRDRAAEREGKSSGDTSLDEEGKDDSRVIPSAPELYATPTEACDSEKLLLSVGMPGIMSRAEVNELLEIQKPLVAIGENAVKFLPCTALVQWEDGDVTEESGYFKQLIADLIAGVGPEVAKEMVIDFTNFETDR